MKTKIIFDYQLNGHNIEYIHHLYVGASLDSQTKYIFSLPEEFNEVKHFMRWPAAENIEFDLYRLSDVKSSKPIVTAWKSSLYLRKLVKKTGAEEIVLVWMMAVLPFIGYLIPKGVKVSGIVYNIYLYLWKQYGILGKVSNVLKYWFLTHCKNINKVFILNDNSAVCKLNRLWKTDKYKYLPDPYVPFSEDVIKDLRDELCIDAGKTICLHLGAMSFKKGTLTVLDIIENSDEEQLNDYAFVFAGKIYPDIKERFYDKVAKLKEKVQIVVKDDFLPYETMGSMVFTCDKVILPYTRIDASSGSIAYASQFGKIVYAPNRGLLGKLVRKYGIGVVLDEFRDINSISVIGQKQNTYCQSHRVEDFNSVILS